MILPEFIATFSNGTRAPWMVCPESKDFANELESKV
jgi:hypothetical protein